MLLERTQLGFPAPTWHHTPVPGDLTFLASVGIRHTCGSDTNIQAGKTFTHMKIKLTDKLLFLCVCEGGMCSTAHVWRPEVSL